MLPKRWVVFIVGLLLGISTNYLFSPGDKSSEFEMPKIEDSAFLVMTNQIIEFEGGWKEAANEYAGIDRSAHPNSPLWKLDLSNEPTSKIKTLVYSIYMTEYYKVLRINDISHEIGFLIYDFGVNSGTRESSLVIQRVVFPTQPHQVDGHLGVFTVNALDNYKGKITEEFTFSRIEYYVGLSKSNPDKYGKYEQGWVNRAKNSYLFSQGVSNEIAKY